MEKTQPTSSPATGGSHSEHLQLLRELLKREHDLLIQRTNVFLLFHSILMAGVALGENGPAILKLLVPSFGIITSLIWAYMGYRNVRAEHHFEELVCASEANLAETFRVFTNFKAQRQGGLHILKSSWWFAYVLPLLWFLVWSVVFLFVVLRWLRCILH
jgi:hypothetical protein